MKTPRAISFDLDDTLWAIWPVIDRAEAVLHEYIRETFPRIGESHDVGDLRLQRNEIHQQRPANQHASGCEKQKKTRLDHQIQ